MRGGKDMRVESHNQKFNNGCTKDSTKRVDVHIFYGFYTGPGSVFSLLLVLLLHKWNLAAIFLLSCTISPLFWGKSLKMVLLLDKPHTPGFFFIFWDRVLRWESLPNNGNEVVNVRTLKCIA